MNTTRIIIVEDDPEVQSLLADFLRREGFAVEVAGDAAGFDALVAGGSRPDLVVIDWMLPVRTGCPCAGAFTPSMALV